MQVSLHRTDSNLRQVLPVRLVVVLAPEVPEVLQMRLVVPLLEWAWQLGRWLRCLVLPERSPVLVRQRR